MKGGKRAAAGFLGIAASLLFLGASMFCKNQVCTMENLRFVSLKETTLSPDLAGEIQESLKEEDLPAVCFWAETGEDWIQNEELHRMVRGSVSVLSGSSELLYPESACLLESDLEGCLIGEDLAYELFGSGKAAGKQLDFQGRRLTARGVLRENPRGLALQADAERTPELKFAGLAVRDSGNGDADAVLSDLENQYGISGRKIATGFYTGAAKIGAFLLHLTIGILLALTGGRKVWRYRRRPAAALAFLVCCLGLLLLLAGSSPASFSIGKDLLPGQWSDFGWFAAKWEELSDQWTHLVRLEKSDTLYRMLKYSGGAVAFGLLSALSLVLCRGRVELERGTRLRNTMGILVLSWAVSFLLIWRGMEVKQFLRAGSALLLYVWGRDLLKGLGRLSKGDWKRENHLAEDQELW